MTLTIVGTAPVTGLSEASGLNATGQVVGQEDGQFPFFWTPSAPNGTTGSSQRLPVLQLPSGGTGVATAINANGDIVGFSETMAAGAQVTRAVVWAAGSGAVTDLGTLIPDPQNPGSFLGSSQALGINDGGLIVGSSDSAVGVNHAFLFDPAVGAMRDLGSLVPATASGTADPSVANGINNLGDIVGDAIAMDANGALVTRAFLVPAGSTSMQDLGTLLVDAAGVMQGNSSAAAINDAKTIVGSSDAGTPGQVQTTPSIFSATRGPVGIVPSIGKATGVNSAGDIVGHLGDPPSNAFKFNNASGVVDDLTTKFVAPGSGTITHALGINSTGQIAAISDQGSVDQAVLLTP